MATGGLYGQSSAGIVSPQSGSESSGLYGNNTVFGGTYFEWIIFQVSDTQPATPTGGSWSFTTNSGIPPTGWVSAPPENPTNTVWVSIGLVNSKSNVAISWSVPGKFAFSSGLPILSGSSTPLPTDGVTDQLYIETGTTPETIWFKQAGTWTRLTGSNLYMDLVSNQTINGSKTFSSQIQGSISGNAANVTGVVALVNGGTGATTASAARTALELGSIAIQNANSISITGGAIVGITDLTIADGGTGASTATDARTNLGLGSAAVLTAGAALGVATLDAGGTIPLSQIPASIQGGVSYQGTWNATTNSPTLTSSVGTKGYYYVVSTAGSTNLNGVTSWNIGDWAIFNGTAWEKIDNTDAVTSVNGYTGTVVLTQPDISGTASLTTTQTLTNKTITSPIINEILDINGNEILGFSPTALASDFLTVKNGIGVGVPLHVYADGPSTNIGLHIQPKGSGLVTISDGTDFNKGIRFRSSGSAASAVTLLDAVSTVGRVVTLPDATTTLVGRDTTDTLTNKTINLANNTLSGTASININGTVGATTANTGAFTTLTTSSTVTHNGGVANGVAFLNGSKVLTTGSALTFDGTTLGLFAASGVGLTIYETSTGNNNRLLLTQQGTVTTYENTYSSGSGQHAWKINGAEQMRLTSTGLGIGTSSPDSKLSIALDAASGSDLENLENSNSGTNTTKFAGIKFRGRDTVNSGKDSAYIRAYPADQDYVGSTLTFWTRGSDSISSKMSLDSAGNLGLGVTPSAWAGFTASQIKNAALWSDGNTAFLSANTYFNSGYKYIATAAASQYLQANGAHSWYTAPSGTAGNAISFTQAMTLDANGNLGIGTTSPSRKLDVAGSQRLSSGSAGTFLEIVGASSNTSYLSQETSSELRFNQADATSNSKITFYTNNGQERMRLDASGNLIQSAPTTPPSLATNGTMVFNLTSNTNLRVSVRGSDGVTRTANITLS